MMAAAWRLACAHTEDIFINSYCYLFFYTDSREA